MIKEIQTGFAQPRFYQDVNPPPVGERLKILAKVGPVVE
jgi:hypothetical protein